MNILVFTDVLPAPLLPHKQQENDVLLLTASLHEAARTDVHYSFVYIATYSNALLALISPKWRTALRFLRLRTYVYAGRSIPIVGVPYIGRLSPLKNWLGFLGFRLNKNPLQQLIAEQQIDLVHAHNIRADAGMAYEVLRAWQIPYIITSRKLGTDVIDRAVQCYLQQAKAIFNLGKVEQELALAYNPHSFLVPHGLDESFLKQQKDYSKGGTLRIVSLCRLLHWKNLDQVIRALEKVHGDFQYEIYGDGPEKEQLQAQINRSSIAPKIKLMGSIPYAEVPGILVQYDLFVLPSFREMFGRVYLEAMACGLPVIGARHCGIDGYIKEGTQGFLVNHKDVSEIQQSIQQFITDPELKICMGKAAKLLSAAFSWSTVIEQIDIQYRKAIA